MLIRGVLIDIFKLFQIHYVCCSICTFILISLNLALGLTMTDLLQCVCVRNELLYRSVHIGGVILYWFRCWERNLLQKYTISTYLL